MKRLLPLSILLLAGCAHDPIVDMQGVNQQQYRQDLYECRQYAEQVNTGKEVVEHAAVGAAVGGAIGAIVGDRHTASQIGGIGAVTGTAKGARKAERRKQRVLYNCLRGRGYKVLG